MPHELIGEMPRHRWTVRRMALMYVPLTIGALALTGISLRALLEGSYGAVIPLTILLVVTGAVTFQAVAALRDLRAQPMFTRGEIVRAWAKGGMLWLFRSHYILVNGKVFVLAPEIWIQLAEGDVVECHHWPHTKTLIRVMLLRGEDASLRPDEPLVPILES